MARFNKLKIKKLYLTSQDKTKGQLSKEVLVTASAEDLNSLVGAATSGTNGLLLAGAYTNGISITGTATNSISISGAATTGINITSATVKSINIANTVTTGTHGIYLKSTVTAFPGSEFIGAYIRAEAATNAATAKSLYGTIIYGTNNAVTQTTGSLWGTLTYAYIKGATAVTIANAYAGQFEISMDAGRSANATITTEAACLLAKVTAGDLADDTKVHGMIIRVGDMDGDSATFGNGILIEDNASMSGTCKFTTGINISSGCTTGINLSGANTTGINISGANTTAINVSAVQTDETGLNGACILKHGTYSTAIAYGTQTDHLVLTSMHITAGATGKYVIGSFLGVDTSATSTGYFIGNYNYLTVNNTVGAAMGFYSEVDVTATAALNGNVSGYYSEMIVNAGTITGAGKINGLLVEVSVTAGVTIAQEVHGIEVDMRGIKADVAGQTVGIKVTEAGGTNYLDYGMQFSNCFDTATAVLDFDLTQGNVACGILMDSGAYTITTGVSFTGIYTTAISITGTCTTALLIPDDSLLSWGASADVSASWTGQELLFEDTRTIDVSDGYNRTIHVGNTVTMTASRYAALSNYTTLAGTGGLDAYGVKAAMVQGATKAVDGHFGGGMFEVKNNAATCSTASAIFLRWDNDSSSGFGGAQSFIRIEDNSSATKVKYLLDTLTVSTNLDADAAMIRTGGNAASNIQFKQGLQVKVNGSAYYIGLIAVGDWQND